MISECSRDLHEPAELAQHATEGYGTEKKRLHHAGFSADIWDKRFSDFWLHFYG